MRNLNASTKKRPATLLDQRAGRRAAFTLIEVIMAMTIILLVIGAVSYTHLTLPTKRIV